MFCTIPEGKRLLGRPTPRWNNNIKMDLKDGGVWTGFIWLRTGKSVVILYYHRKHKLPYCPGYIASGRTVEKTLLLALLIV
jgi:hypothetical protein